MNAYSAMMDEDPPSKGELVDCYPQLALLLMNSDVQSWDGYTGSNPHVLDGSSFSLTITRSDGSELHARGTNASPRGFNEFERTFIALFSEA